MPFGRHLAGLRYALVEHPAPLPALPLGPLVEVVAVAELVGADKLAVEPSENAGAERHGFCRLGLEVAADYIGWSPGWQAGRMSHGSCQVPVRTGFSPAQ